MPRKQDGLVPIGEAYGRSWLTTALSRPALSCFCPVKVYPNLTSGIGR